MSLFNGAVVALCVLAWIAAAAGVMWAIFGPPTGDLTQDEKDSYSREVLGEGPEQEQ